MIFQSKIESRLGLRFFSGGASGSNGSTTPQLTPQEYLNMYQTAIPSTLSAINGTAGGTAQTLAQSAAQANPVYTQSGLDQLNQYSSGYQAAGNQLATQQAGATNQLIQGAGGQAAQSAVALNNSLNPVQAANNKQATSLANAYNLGGLSPGQANAVERSTNQSNYGTGNLGVLNGTNTVSNAMNFGNAYNQQVSNAANALNASNSVANSQNAQVNPYSVATSAGNTGNNFGLNNLSTTQANANLTLPYSTASSFGNQLAGIGAASKGTTSSGSANGGCFLTTAACEMMKLPDDCYELQTLRSFRDQHVPKTLVQEYYQVAPSICMRITPEQLHMVWLTVKQCVHHIEQKQYSEAIGLYKNMVEELK